MMSTLTTIKLAATFSVALGFNSSMQSTLLRSIPRRRLAPLPYEETIASYPVGSEIIVLEPNEKYTGSTTRCRIKDPVGHAERVLQKFHIENASSEDENNVHGLHKILGLGTCLVPSLAAMSAFAIELPNINDLETITSITEQTELEHRIVDIYTHGSLDSFTNVCCGLIGVTTFFIVVICLYYLFKQGGFQKIRGGVALAGAATVVIGAGAIMGSLLELKGQRIHAENQFKNKLENITGEEFQENDFATVLDFVHPDGDTYDADALKQACEAVDVDTSEALMVLGVGGAIFAFGLLLLWAVVIYQKKWLKC